MVLYLVLRYCSLFLGMTLRVANTTRKKGLPRPHPKTFNNLGQGIDDYNNAEIILLLVVRTTEMRRLMGPCFPTGGWFLRGRLNLILFVKLIAYLHCCNSRRTHIDL